MAATVLSKLRREYRRKVKWVGVGWQCAECGMVGAVPIHAPGCSVPALAEEIDHEVKVDVNRRRGRRRG